MGDPVTTGRDDTRPARAVVVGADRPAAAQVFGDAFDRLLTTTYEELGADLAAERAAHDAAGAVPDPVGFVGVAAGPGMQAGVDAALALVQGAARDAATSGRPAPELVVEVPWDLDALDHLRARLGEPGAPVLSDVRRYRDRPCLVLGGPAAPTHDPAWVLGALLTAGTTAPDARVAEQERVAAEWERAAARDQLARAEAECDRLREQLQRRAAGATGRPERSGSRPAAARPAPSGGPRAVLGSLLGALGRRAGRGARTGALVVGVVAVLALLVPGVVLGLLAGEPGVAVGLALGATLVAVGALGAVVLGAHVATARRLEAVQADVARHGRAASDAGRLAADAAGRAHERAGRQGERLGALEGGLRALPEVVAREGRATRRQVQAVVNLAAMAPLRAGLPPLDGDDAAPDLAVELVDRLVVERPGLAVVAGGGAATVLLALAAREHGLDTRVVALDHDAGSAARTRDLLARHGVADRAEVRWAPLARTHVPDHLTPWYDEEALADLHDVGLLVVDGPPATVGPDARYPAVPLLRDRLAPRCTVLVDDVAGEAERAVVDRWARLLPDFGRRDLALTTAAVALSRG